jgi:K+-sensing histidine kinase KdpD
MIGSHSKKSSSVIIMPDEASEGGQDCIPWSDTSRFIRQLGHDLRNDLNAIELQSTYISELERTEELKGEIKRLREMVSTLASTLQRLSSAVGEIAPNPIPYRASDFIEDLRSHIQQDFPKESAEITWDVQLGDAMLNIDPQLLQEVLSELITNAFRHDRGKGPIMAAAKIADARFLFTFQEPKSRFDSSTQNWGREPLRKITQRHYGLGLNRARAIVEAHGGKLHAQYDPKVSALITTLTLPVAGKSSKQA